MRDDKKTIMVFGVFDLLHEGHRHFLSEAKRLGEWLITVVAQDSVVVTLKGQFPTQILAERVKNLRASGIPDEVVAGDVRQSSWECVVKYAPDVIAFGYDQKNLKRALEKFLAANKLVIKCVFITPHRDGMIHSSVIRKGREACK